MKSILLYLLVVANLVAKAQIPTGDVRVEKTELSYPIKLEKGGLYSVVVVQKGIDVVVRLKEKGTEKILVEKDSPEREPGTGGI
ncbi:MAG: hypothetical protein WDO15_02015 [Bacteroidota bacterium]